MALPSTALLTSHGIPQFHSAIKQLQAEEFIKLPDLVKSLCDALDLMLSLGKNKEGGNTEATLKCEYLWPQRVLLVSDSSKRPKIHFTSTAAPTRTFCAR